MRKKGGLRRGSIWIEGDLTWEERKTKWFREAVMREERREARIWIRNGRAMIEGKWWFWDESNGVLKDRLGRKEEGGVEGSGEERRRVD